MTNSSQPRTDSARVRGLVVEAVQAAHDLMSTPKTAELWDEPSALEGMTVGALAAHLVRAAGATIAYLDRTPADEPPTGELLTPVTYFHGALDAPIHDKIKDVSATEASIGAEATVQKCAQLMTDLKSRLDAEPDDRLIGALNGSCVSLDDFCRTRLIEVLLHLDDLAASTGQARPETDPLGTEIVIGICMDIARHRQGDWNVIHALSRAERSSADVFPVF